MIFINNDENPWGDGPTNSPKNDKVKSFKRPQSSQQSPSIDDLTKSFRKQFGGGSGGGGENGGGIPPNILLLGPVLLLGLWLVSGFFRVQEGELGVVLRFGKMVSTAAPGLRYRLPFPFEEEYLCKVGVINKIDGVADNRDEDQTLILTGDENMVHTNYTVQWKIKDVTEYLFTAKNPDETIRVAAESVVRQVIAESTARLSLTEGRETISSHAQELLQKILDTYKMGVNVLNFQLQSVTAPSEVVEAFNDMQASLVDADRLKNEAESYRNDIIPRARGAAEQIKQEAEAYKQKVVAKATGDAARFDAVYEGYRNNRDVTSKRYYLETMAKVFAKANKTIIDSSVGNGVMPYVNLDKKQPKQK
jgi:membrane protease subunit HflK